MKQFNILQRTGLSVYVILFLSIFFVGFLGVGSAFAHEHEKGLDDVKNYNIYYGGPTPQMMREVNQFDLLILEPRNFSKEEVEQIKQKGTLVYGYISPVETASWMRDLIPQLDENDYYTVNGQKITINTDIHLMDITQPHYQKLLKDEIRRLIVDKGFDGIFLDAMGDIEYWQKDRPGVMAQQKEAMFQFLDQVHQEYPTVKMIQNGGSDLLKEYTWPLVNGFMWENLSYTWASASDDAQLRIAHLKHLIKCKDLRVLTIVPNEPEVQMSAKYSKQMGFVPMISAFPGVQWGIPPNG